MKAKIGKEDGGGGLSSDDVPEFFQRTTKLKKNRRSVLAKYST